MLYQLNIQDFALIDTLEIKFHSQLNVLSGETGAGKSIIIDAVSLLLGARGQSEFIRDSKEKAIVEGVFYVDHKETIGNTIENYGIPLDDEDGILILTREVSSSGRNLCRINNRIVTLGVFKEIGSQLINIYGQHDYQALSQSEKHIEILDSLGDKIFRGLLIQVEKSYYDWVNEKKKLTDYHKLIKDKSVRIDFLRFQISEIHEINPIKDEEATIENELTVLNNIEKIVKNSNEGYNLLYGNNAIYDQLSEVSNKILEIAQYDPILDKLSNELEEARYQVEDSARTLRSYIEGFDFDASSLDELQERKFLLNKIKRKYGCKTINELIDLKQDLEKELITLEESETLILATDAKIKEFESIYFKKAQELSSKRSELAKELEKKITEQLIQLSMIHTKFKVEFKEVNGNSKGIDKIEFLISPNPGEPLRSLAKIASGGEMSRIMLAFKVILADLDIIGTMIFDEIDTGIGGKVVGQVAEKLYHVGNIRQVICVTHSPHIASLANNHLKITKEIFNNKTLTKIYTLCENERIDELSRMLGDSGEVTITYAKEMRKQGIIKGNQAVY